MTAYKPFDVILVPFPFTDQPAQKQRPALVLKTVPSKLMEDLLICAMITSQTEGEMIEGDMMVREWESAGLIHASKLRLAKLVTLQNNIVRKKLGRILSADQKVIVRHIKKFWAITGDKS